MMLSKLRSNKFKDQHWTNLCVTDCKDNQTETEKNNVDFIHK